MSNRDYTGYKLYVIVDSFLDRSQQAVQACHAVAAFCLTYRQGEALSWGNQNIVLMKSKDIAHWQAHADAQFKEPHWDNKLTAVAMFRPAGFIADGELQFV